MDEPWHTVLASATVADSDELQFNGLRDEARYALEGNVVTPRPDVGVIHVRGDEATTFLHAQLTHAMNDLPPQASRLAAWCSAKGRMLALLRVLRTDDGFLLLLPHRSVGPILQRLKMFVLRARVELGDLSAEVGVLGVAGAASANLLAEATGSPPTEADAVTEAGDLRVIRVRDPADRFLVLAPTGQLEALWTLLRRGLRPVGTAAWRLLDIRAGLPEILPETTERFVPQMANLEALNALSYTKGCYPGQEVVARMHYLGRLKRRMYRVELAHGSSPPPGAAVRDADGAEAGNIVIAAPTPAPDTVEALTVLRIEAAQRSDLEVEGVRLTLCSLPYDVDSPDKNASGSFKA